MAILNPKELKQEARHILSTTACDHRKIILIYSGAMVGLMLASGGLQLYLDQQISNTGGLGGLGMRSMLQTVQTILSYVNIFFGPFWSAGLMSVIIQLTRGENPGPRNLLDGFRKFGRLLSYLLLEMCIAMLLATSSSYIASFLFTLTPPGQEFTAALMPLMDSGVLMTAEGTINLSAVPMNVLMDAAIPICLLFLAVFIPLYGFAAYSMRMGRFLLIINNKFRGFSALLFSLQYMKGHKLQMLKLDLSYWWYYLLAGLITAAGYLDVILSSMGIALPFGNEVAYFVTLALYGILTLALDLWMRMQVDSTYVLAYRKIRNTTNPLPGDTDKDNTP